MGKHSASVERKLHHGPQRKDSDYTPRQLLILSGDVDLADIRSQELAVLQRKAVARNDKDIYEIVSDMVFAKAHEGRYVLHYTVEEAKQVLQSLTPWAINWNPNIIKNRIDHIL